MFAWHLSSSEDNYYQLLYFYKRQSNRFNILNYVTISNKNTHSSNKITLCHVRSSTSKSKHFYFNRLPRLWNRLPAIDITLSSRSIRASLREFLWNHALHKNLTIHALITFYVHVANALPFRFICCKEFPCCKTLFIIAPIQTTPIGQRSSTSEPTSEGSTSEHQLVNTNSGPP